MIKLDEPCDKVDPRELFCRDAKRLCFIQPSSIYPGLVEILKDLHVTTYEDDLVRRWIQGPENFYSTPHPMLC